MAVKCNDNGNAASANDDEKDCSYKKTNKYVIIFFANVNNCDDENEDEKLKTLKLIE